MAKQHTKIFYWFDDEYRVTDYEDAGIVMIEKLRRRSRHGEKWRVVFHSHTELLRNITEYTDNHSKDKE